MKKNQLTAILCLGGALLFPILFQDPYFLHMAILIGIYGLLSISLNLLLGYTGQLSLGHAGFFGVGAYLSSLTYLNLGIPLWGGVAAALAGSGLLGFFVARLAFKLRGAYFVIMTIGIAEVLKLVALNWVDLTKGPMGLTDIAAPEIHLGFMTIDFSQKLPYFYLVLFFVVLAFVLQNRLVNSTFGRSFIAIRENEDLAESVGIDAFKYLVIVVIVSSSIAGVAGSLYAHYVSFIDPGVFAFFISVNAVMMAIGGGQGTQAGPLLGAVLFTLIPEWLRVFGDARMAVYALMVIFIVIFMPKGMLFYVVQMLNLGKKNDGR
ncbi:MAG: branched-chain amino acid ABC transporter permease [Deltaproteobacteria bacterium]|nr:MAG: branched-chain amino acid ABC transporter permease [Deltaproteobacteria bacterium]